MCIYNNVYLLLVQGFTSIDFTSLTKRCNKQQQTKYSMNRMQCHEIHAMFCLMFVKKKQYFSIIFCKKFTRYIYNLTATDVLRVVDKITTVQQSRFCNSKYLHNVIHDGISEARRLSVVKRKCQSVQWNRQFVYDEGIQDRNIKLWDTLDEVWDGMLRGFYQTIS